MTNKTMRKITPNDMKLSRTTFAFEKNLIKMTMEAHQPNPNAKLLGSADIIKNLIEYKGHYLRTYKRCDSLVSARKNPDAQASISHYTAKHVRNQVQSEELVNMN